MQQRSVCLKGKSSACLVRVPDVGNPTLISDLARDKAIELGIYPGRVEDDESESVIAYYVDEQDESFYDRIIEWD